MSLGQAQTSSPPQQRAELAERLRGRRGEIEQTALSRVQALADPAGADDPLYAVGLRSAVSVAVSFGIDRLERGEERPDPIPAELLRQARHAARRGVPLDTVLRRYLAGHALLGEFIFEEAEAASLAGAELREALRAEAGLLDHLIDAVAAEYQSEVADRSRSSQRRRLERVEKLLAGELNWAVGLGYELEAWHVGAVVAGIEGEGEARELADSLDRRLLTVPCGKSTAWIWLGGAREVSREEMECLAEAGWGRGARVAIGEPGRGVAGWRLSHRQAAAALPVALRGPAAPVRYADVALVAAALGDETLTSSLRGIYLQRLSAERDGGLTLRETLRAYFNAERTLSAAAAALGVARNTVASRLRTVEQLIGRPLGACAPQLEVALRLEELGRFTAVESFE
jgi:hypothetical protein